MCSLPKKSKHDLYISNNYLPNFSTILLTTFYLEIVVIVAIAAVTYVITAIAMLAAIATAIVIPGSMGMALPVSRAQLVHIVVIPTHNFV